MRASKQWHCQCGKKIMQGEEFFIVDGEFIKSGCLHDTIEEAEAIFDRIERENEPVIFTQLDAFPEIKRDLHKLKKNLPTQESIYDLPLFNLEYQETEQLSLFQ